MSLPTSHPTVAGLHLERVWTVRHADSYHTHYSAACTAGGDGVCDGYCPDDDRPCDCSCHTAIDLPITVPEVRDWHDRLNDVARDDDDNPHQWRA